jgi:hypothetical protein
MCALTRAVRASSNDLTERLRYFPGSKRLTVAIKQSIQDGVISVWDIFLAGLLRRPVK